MGLLRKFATGAALMAAPVVFSDEPVRGFTGNPRGEAANIVFSNSEPAAITGQLRICAFNLENFEDGIGDGPFRTAAAIAQQTVMAATMLDKIDADILFLQEIENGEMLMALNAKLKRPYAMGFITDFGDGSTDRPKQNDAILSRVPVTHVREIDFGPLTGWGRPTRGLMSFRTDLGNGHRLLAYGGHLKSNHGDPQRNIYQRRAALRIMRTNAEAVIASDTNSVWELVFMGDTNYDPQLPSFAKDHSFEPIKDWSDLWCEVPEADRVTIPGRKQKPPMKDFPSAAFDRFIVSPSLREAPWQTSLPTALREGADTADAGTLPGYGNHVSDHYPVWIDLAR